MESYHDFRHPLPTDDVAAIDELGKIYQAFRNELRKAIVGQDLVIEQLAICLFARGHALLMGVPGLAKTLLIRSLSQAVDLKFNRIQFTPDLMPSDITGTEVIQEDRATGQQGHHQEVAHAFAHAEMAEQRGQAQACGHKQDRKRLPCDRNRIARKVHVELRTQTDECCAPRDEENIANDTPREGIRDDTWGRKSGGHRVSFRSESMVRDVLFDRG
jgi:hypothetical protein